MSVRDTRRNAPKNHYLFKLVSIDGKVMRRSIKPEIPTMQNALKGMVNYWAQSSFVIVEVKFLRMVNEYY